MRRRGGSGEGTRSTRAQEHEGHELGDEDALEHEGDASVTRAERRSAHSARLERGYGVSSMQGVSSCVANRVKLIVL